MLNSMEDKPDKEKPETIDTNARATTLWQLLDHQTHLQFLAAIMKAVINDYK